MKLAPRSSAAEAAALPEPCQCRLPPPDTARRPRRLSRPCVCRHSEAERADCQLQFEVTAAHYLVWAVGKLSWKARKPSLPSSVEPKMVGVCKLQQLQQAATAATSHKRWLKTARLDVGPKVCLKSARAVDQESADGPVRWLANPCMRARRILIASVCKG